MPDHRGQAYFSSLPGVGYTLRVTSQATFFIVQRHGSMTTNDYVTQKYQFLLTSLPFNKRPVLLESF